MSTRNQPHAQSAIHIAEIPKARKDDTISDNFVASKPGLLDLGPALVNVLLMVPLEQRLAVACVSRDLKDFVYDHEDLYTNLSVSGPAGRDVDAPVTWASNRGRVRRLRAVVHDHSRKNDTDHDTLKVSLNGLVTCVGRLETLISLQLWITTQTTAADSIAISTIPGLISSLSPSSLRQLTVCVPGLRFPSTGARLSALTSLCLRATEAASVSNGNSAATGAGVVTMAPQCLPDNLERLEVCCFGQPELPEALTGVSRLKALTLDWAWENMNGAVTPDLSLLEKTKSNHNGQDWWWCDHLTHLGLGYFQAQALPEALPASLVSLDLQWNLRTAEPSCRKLGFDVESFHRSFSCLEPLTALTHLNLNNALGAWGLPPSVAKLTQLESLGVAGTAPSWPLIDFIDDDDDGMNIGGNNNNGLLAFPPRGGPPLAPQLARFRRLKCLDVEIYEAAVEWEDLATLTGLERLRLAKSKGAEGYVHPDVRAVVGRGLVRLLPVLSALKEVHTEGMLLPATAACGRWERLLGFESPELRKEAAAAVETLRSRKVALSRWFTWPFGPFGPQMDGVPSWDEVERRKEGI